MVIKHFPGTFSQVVYPRTLEDSAWWSLNGVVSRLLLTTDDSCHIGLQIHQAVYGKFRPDSKHNIAGRWKQVTMKTEDLPYQPFNSVAPHGTTSFSVHTNSQPIVTFHVRQINHGKPVPSESLTKPINELKLPGCLEQVNFRESETVQPAQAANCLRPFALLRLITA